MQQTSFQRTRWAHRFSHGGTLRSERAGRSARPISTKEPIHLIFKTNKGLSGAGLRSARRFQLVQLLMRKYARKFHVKLEQVSVQFDHIHLLVRVTRRSLFQHFLRVTAGQIAQQFHAHSLGLKSVSAAAVSATDTSAEPSKRNATGTSGHPSKAKVTGTPKLRARERRTKLWMYRPFTRVVRGWKAYRVVRDYINLNEMEATGEIRYSKTRLRGLSPTEVAILRGIV